MACISKGRSAWARQLCPSRGSTLASRSSSRLGTLRCPFPSRSEPAGSACTTAQARWRQGSVTTAARGGTAGQRGSGQRGSVRAGSLRTLRRLTRGCSARPGPAARPRRDGAHVARPRSVRGTRALGGGGATRRSTSSQGDCSRCCSRHPVRCCLGPPASSHARRPSFLCAVLGMRSVATNSKQLTENAAPRVH